MAKLTRIEEDARALRDLRATRYGLSTWGFIWRGGFLILWLATIVGRMIMGIPPTWLTPLFAVMFTVMSREIWDGIRRRRFDQWQIKRALEEQDEASKNRSGVREPGSGDSSPTNEAV